MKRVFFLLFAFTCLFQVGVRAKENPSDSNIIQEKEGTELPQEIVEELKYVDGKGGDTRFFQEFMNMLFYLGIIVFFIIVLTWFLKRMLASRVEQVNTKSSIKILERRPITQKTTIYILGIFGKTVAIADSTNGITLLSESSVKESESVTGILPRERGN